jgi:RHS repeat-associated protein
MSYTYYTEGDYVEGALNTYTTNVNGSVTEYTYSYDSDGNITGIVEGSGNTTSYTYDDLGRIISETHGVITRTYDYDDAGNITTITETAPKEEIDPDPGFKPIIHWALKKPYTTESKIFEYENSQYGDLLISYDGQPITYDDIGNPLSYYNGTSYYFTWEGKRLVGATSGSKTMSFSYNDEGIRTKKTVNGVETKYYLFGSQIMSEKTDTRTIVYIYDATYSPIGMMYRKNNYAENVFDVFWFEKNILGDVIAVYNSNGTKLVTYIYTDSWGNHTVSYSNGGGSTGAIYNPFRHRSYYYDTNLGMYYLESRYYDANTCRFISPYNNPVIEQGTPEANAYSYCFNNPIDYICYTGAIFLPFWALTSFGEIHRAVQLYIYENNKSSYQCEKTVESGNEKGRIDLLKNGKYAYEIKTIHADKDKAEAQLQRYICLSEGKYCIGIDQPELTGSFTHDNRFKVEYKYAENGIIRYQFTIEKKAEELSHAPISLKNESLNNNEISASIGSIIVFGLLALGGPMAYCIYKSNEGPIIVKTGLY